MREARCPKCGAEIGDTYEAADWSVGISAGYYCDACALGVAEHEAGEREPMEGDVQISFARDPSEPIGTPASELSGQPGDPRDLGDPRHVKYENFKRIARSWGYD